MIGKCTLLALLAALFTPTQALASSCPPPRAPPSAPPDLPAGVWEYQQAASVAVVTARRVAQPPCFWIKFRRTVDNTFGVPAERRAYIADTCEAAARSQRYELTVIETLKGNPPGRFPAILGGKYPADPVWMRTHRPDWLRAGVTPANEFELVGGYGWEHSNEVAPEIRTGG